MQENPVYEALFNLVNVWSLMLLPLMLADPKGVKVKNKFGWYLGTQVCQPLDSQPAALSEGSRGASTVSWGCCTVGQASQVAGTASMSGTVSQTAQAA